MSRLHTQPLPLARSPVNHMEDDLEHRAFHYFSNFTVPSMASNFFSNFWTKTVREASFAQPIRHAIMALGALHEDFDMRMHNVGALEDATLRTFAFHHYTEGIAALHNLMAASPSSLNHTLISCILFIVYNCLLDHQDAALIHLQAGLKIFHDMQTQKYGRVQGATPWETEFASLLLGLGVQVATSHTSQRTDHGWVLQSALREAGVTNSAVTFCSLDEARHALDIIIAESVVNASSLLDPFHDTSVPSGSGHVVRRSAALEAWSTEFDRYLAKAVKEVTHTDQLWHRATLLKVHFVVLCMSIGVASNTNEKFDEVLTMCQTLIPRQNITTPAMPVSSFSIDMDVTAPLLYVASNSPELCLRRRVFHILSRSSKREGIWDSEQAMGRARSFITDTASMEAYNTWKTGSEEYRR